jgi:hypothetical protein
MAQTTGRQPSAPRRPSVHALRLRVRRLERSNRELVGLVLLILGLLVPGVLFLLALYLLWAVLVKFWRAGEALRTQARIRKRREERARRVGTTQGPGMAPCSGIS